MLRLLQHGDDRSVHYSLLHGRLEHVFLVLLAKHRVDVLRVHDVTVVELLHVRLLIEDLARNKPLLVVDGVIGRAHVLHDVHLWRHFPLHGATLGQEGLDLRTVLFNVIIGNMLDAIDVVGWRLMQVVVVAEAPCSLRAKSGD